MANSSAIGFIKKRRVPLVMVVDDNITESVIKYTYLGINTQSKDDKSYAIDPFYLKPLTTIKTSLLSISFSISFLISISDLE